MKICGLTGGIGTGKSTAAGFFAQAGARIIDTDLIARELVGPGSSALAEIETAFGPAVLAPDGALRRDELARIVFDNELARKKLEAILHPRIRESWLAQIETLRGQHVPVVVVVIPLLFETHAETYFGKIVCTACSAVTQRERLRARGLSPEQTGQRIAAQMPSDHRIARSDYVIWTEGTLDVHRRQVVEVFGKI